MGNEITKIERLGLGKTVQQLMASGITVGRQIAEILRDNHGADISDSAVCRYVAKIKDDVKPDAAGVFRDHINNEIPKDLQALEDIQDKSNSWWKEEPADTARRLASKFALVDDELEFYQGLLLRAELGDHKARVKAVKQIIHRCLGYLAEDARLQKKRMEAMKMELDAIKIKLANAGALDADTGGNIIIVDKRSDYRAPSKDNDGRVPFTVTPGGKAHG